MKKILVLLMVMAIAVGSVFAAEGQWGGSAISGDGVDPKATLEVTLKLSGNDLFNIGFASEEVTTENIDTVANNPLKTLALELDGSEYQGKAYVYYGIKSLTANKYDVSLSIDGALTAPNDEEGIAWGISSGGSSFVTSGEANTPKVIFDGVGSASDNVFKVESKELAISTTDFQGELGLDTTNQYSATVTLTIANNT